MKNTRTVRTNIPSTAKSLEIMRSVIGQLSDGIWENTRGYGSYWYCADIIDDDGFIAISVNSDRYYWYLDKLILNRYFDMSDAEIRKFFRNKLRTIVRHEANDNPMYDYSFTRDNAMTLDYIGYKETIEVGDVFNVFNILKQEPIF